MVKQPAEKAGYDSAGRMIMTSRVSEARKAPFLSLNYAHRGLHSPDGSVPENSLAAFRRASEAGYGVELDVQLSSDRRVVVFHDASLTRVTGAEGRVDTRTYDELSRLRLCGTDETIPLFSEVLQTIRGGGPLITELKTGPRYPELCRAVLEQLRACPVDFCVESFDPRIVNWFRKNAPDIVRGQLSAPYADMKASVRNPLVAFLLSRCAFRLINRPDFIAYKLGKRPRSILRLRGAGLMLFGWTAREAPAPDENDGVIFEFYEPSRRF